MIGAIYADYHSTTPIDPRVLDSMSPYWQLAFGNPHSTEHVMGWEAAEAASDAATAIGALIGADASEITFTSGATEANNLAVIGLARRAPANRRRILVSAVEHKSVLGAATAVGESNAFSVESIPVDGQGAIDYDALERMLDSNVLIASVMAVGNEVGAIQDLPKIARMLRPYGILLHSDAAQAPVAVDTRELALYTDLLSLSGHKMYGPKGIGALYIRRGLEDRLEPLLYGGGQQRGLRSGTVPVPLCVGMGTAASILTANGNDERQRVALLRNTFIRLLREGIRRMQVNGPTGRLRHPGNANIQFDGFAAQDILGVLQPRLAASTGSACASGIPEPSHVLRAMGFSANQADSAIRFSFGRFTTDDDVCNAAQLVIDALGRLSPSN